MQRLTGLDAGFLYMETPSSAMHIAGLAIFDPSTAPGGWTVEKYKELVRSRLHLAPPFRRRLVEVPFQLHHPLWIEDPDFDLDWHVRHIAVPAPGGPNELAELASHLVSLQLERSRPLWEIWLIEGLENGNIATLSKIHHSAIDGASGAELTVSLFDLSPEIAEVPPPERPWVPDRLPTDAEMVSYAMASLARQPIAAVKAARRTASAAITLRRTNRQPGITPPPAPFSAPRTSINRPLTPHRAYAMATVSLSDVKAVKNAFGTTVNDVILALCGGALRHYFDDHDEKLDGPLVAMVPVSVRSDDEKKSMGNRVIPSLTSLATDIDDPVERLLSIHEAMRRTKDQTDMIGADTLTNWAEFATPAVFARATRLYSNMKMADRHRPLFNVTISNVPGPPFPLFVAGAKMIANYPVGPIFDGGGLNMTVMSYQDNLDFGLLACPDVVDDVWSIAAALSDALAEMMEAVHAYRSDAEGSGPAGHDVAEAPPTGDVERAAVAPAEEPAPADTSLVEALSSTPATTASSASEGNGSATTSAQTRAARTSARKASAKGTSTKPSATKAPAAKRTPTTEGATAKAPKAKGSTTKGTTAKAPKAKGSTTKGTTTKAPTTKRASTKPTTTKGTTAKVPSANTPATKGAAKAPTRQGPTTNAPKAKRASTRSAKKAAPARS
jgi:WS/DGAT/MGAT family acyltransferase